MTIRLVERFRVGDPAEVLFRGEDAETWIEARVVAHAHPGVWVEVPGGSRWFVTNGSRIRERGAGSRRRPTT